MGRLIFEIWYYNAPLPNSGGAKLRPVLIIGSDAENQLNIVDVHYCMLSASSKKGKYDVEIDETTAKAMGLKKASVIKTTKIYTVSQALLEKKICDLPQKLKAEFVEKYKAYQSMLMNKMDE